MQLVNERPHNQYGSAIFIKEGLDAQKTFLSEHNKVEILTVQLSGFAVTCIYKPPAVPFEFTEPPMAPMPYIVLGDFNSNGTNCGYMASKGDGMRVERWA